MKRSLLNRGLIALCMIICGAVVMTSCNDPKDPSYPNLVVDIDSDIIIALNGSRTFEITEGSGFYGVEDDDDAIITASIEDNILTITGKSVGDTSLRIFDQKSSEEITVDVTVADKLILDTNSITVAPGIGGKIKIKVGSGEYTIGKHDRSYASASVKGDYIIVTGTKGAEVGEITIDITDDILESTQTITVTIEELFYVDIAYHSADGSSIITLDAADEDKSNIWIDLNGNKIKDEGEEVTVFGEPIPLDLTTSSGEFSIYGKVHTIELEYLIVENIKISGNKELMHLSITANDISSINVKEHTKLVTLELTASAQLTSLDVTNCLDLETLNIGKATMTSLDLTNNTKLKRLNLSELGSLTAIDLSQNTMLQKLVLGEVTAIANLDLSKNTELTEIHIIRCIKLTNVNFGTINKVTTLRCFENAITDIDIKSMTELSYLSLASNKLTAVPDMTNNVKIDTMILSGSNYLSFDLDLSIFPNLKELMLDGCISNIAADVLTMQEVLDKVHPDTKPNIGFLSVCSNNIITLDLTDFTGLVRVQCYQNRFDETGFNKLLGTLPVRKYLEVDETYGNFGLPTCARLILYYLTTENNYRAPDGEAYKVATDKMWDIYEHQVEQPIAVATKPVN